MPKAVALAAALAVLVCSGSTSSALADYPTKPITLMIGFAPGGPSDVMARILTKKMEAMLKAGAFGQMLSTMMPLGRPGWPDDLAKAVLFLSSDLSSYVSGNNLLVDGGQLLR